MSAEQFLESPDVPGEDDIDTYYSRDLVLGCIEAALEASTVWRNPATASVDDLPFLGLSEEGEHGEPGEQYVITDLHCKYTGGPAKWTWKCATTFDIVYGIRLAAWMPLPPPPTFPTSWARG